MRLALLIACLASPTLAQDAVGSRIAQSAAAAERQQGPLDGAWRLQDGRGRTLFVFQVGDPPSGRLSCAWRRPDGALGVADCQRTGGWLTIAFGAVGKPRVMLRRIRGGLWHGELTIGGAGRAVSLRRR